MITVLKLGGELLDDAADVCSAANAIVSLAARSPLVVVHGGGRAIDAELRARGEQPSFVDGLRITDAPALDAAVSVLAGRTNTALVAAIGAAGGRAVGLTGADGLIGLSTKVDTFTTVAGQTVDLGLVGQPDGHDASLLTDLVRIGCIPVIASIGVSREGALLNVNADTLASHLAGIIGAGRLIIAGATAGVLDRDGVVIPTLSLDAVDRMIASGEAHSGMVAKLTACRAALLAGVREVAVVAGRTVGDFDVAVGTVIYRELVTT
ncbi:MAG TPA: acetylglutamate kinase [Vicinamibacterales bacterium]|jgi:acetylglutamate kinase|nr:acetylglutamate kinase [Vicinamibacterales bacterium]